MPGIIVEYEYSGDEGPWETVIKEFIGNINSDPKLQGKFTYHVNVKEDGKGRLHLASWDSQETLSHLQSQTFFSDFAGKVKEFAGGDGPRATKVTHSFKT